MKVEQINYQPAKVKDVTITFTIDELKVIRVLTGSVAGVGNFRDICDRINHSIQKLDIPMPTPRESLDCNKQTLGFVISDKADNIFK